MFSADRDTERGKGFTDVIGSLLQLFTFGCHKLGPEGVNRNIGRPRDLSMVNIEAEGAVRVSLRV